MFNNLILKKNFIVLLNKKKIQLWYKYKFFFFKFLNLFFFKKHYLFSMKIFQKNNILTKFMSYIKFKKIKKYKPYNYFKFSIIKYNRFFNNYYWYKINNFLSKKIHLNLIHNEINYKSNYNFIVYNFTNAIDQNLHTKSYELYMDFYEEEMEKEEDANPIALNNQFFLFFIPNLFIDKKINLGKYYWWLKKKMSFQKQSILLNLKRKKKIYFYANKYYFFVKKLKKKRREVSKLFKYNNNFKNTFFYKKKNVYDFYITSKCQLEYYDQYFNKNNNKRQIDYLTYFFFTTKNKIFFHENINKVFKLKIFFNSYNYKTIQWRIIN